MPLSPIPKFIAAPIILILLLYPYALAEDSPTFPILIQLQDSYTNISIQRPVAIVAGSHTTIYVASASGQLLLADIKTGLASIINRGGDDQPIGGLCLDSRGPGTLYATGRETGTVFAFNRRGELLQKYQLTTRASKGGTSFLSSCIQTRYQLLVIDSYNPTFFYIPLSDEGPLRGHPPLLTDTVFQGVRVPYDLTNWPKTVPAINAFGVEWSQKFNETAYVLNSPTGQLFTLIVKKTKVVPNMLPVTVSGKVTTFPGALGILFDSTNENVMYISMPRLNAIAVLEFSRMFPRQAKFIRYLKSSLVDGPIAVGEYGDWIFPISGNYRQRPNSKFTMPQVPRHEQIIDAPESEDPFTETLNDVPFTAPLEVIRPSDVIKQTRARPSPVGTSAPISILAPSKSEDLNSEPQPTTLSIQQASPSPEPVSIEASDGEAYKQAPSAATSRIPSVFDIAADSNDNDNDDNDGIQSGQGSSSCFPSHAVVMLDNNCTKRMDQLRIGDRVMVRLDSGGKAIFSKVFMFSHRNYDIVHNFVRLDTNCGQTLEVSDGHYIYVNGVLTAAGTVEVGDIVGWKQGEAIRVRRVSNSRAVGLFNPQTIDGDIMVNGMQVSTYTTAMRPRTALALTVPIRAAFACGSRWPERISWMLRNGMNSVPRLRS